MFCSNRMFIKNELGTIGTSDYKQVLKAVWISTRKQDRQQLEAIRSVLYNQTVGSTEPMTENWINTEWNCQRYKQYCTYWTKWPRPSLGPLEHRKLVGCPWPLTLYTCPVLHGRHEHDFLCFAYFYLRMFPN